VSQYERLPSSGSALRTVLMPFWATRTCIPGKPEMLATISPLVYRLTMSPNPEAMVRAFFFILVRNATIWLSSAVVNSPFGFAMPSDCADMRIIPSMSSAIANLFFRYGCRKSEVFVTGLILAES
jgi:hypothetical protein